MKVYEAVKSLENKSCILIDEDGNKFQRLNNRSIMQIWNDNIRKNTGSVASSISNDEFIEKYLLSSFDEVKQWFHGNIKFPILCKVKEMGWSDYKTVCFNSKSGDMLNTQFSESYFLNYNTEIIPLDNTEIENFKNRISQIEEE